MIPNKSEEKYKDHGEGVRLVDINKAGKSGDISFEVVLRSVAAGLEFKQ